MANLIDYARKYGSLNNYQKEFNEVDYLILATLSYVDFDGILHFNNNKVTLYEAGIEYFTKYDKRDYKNNVMGIQAAIDIFKAIYTLPRYKELLCYNYRYIRSDNEQFSAMFIDINRKLTYISFEGTDDLIAGWKEDAELAYKFPVSAHKDAISYINKHISPISKRKYIIGGHSKGGNIALVAAMYANTFIWPKISHVYSFDGPGLKKKQIESHAFRRMNHKYHLIVPNYSVVGLLLRHPNPTKVIASDHSGLVAHNTLYWMVNDDKFVESELTDFSKRVDNSITTWLDNYNDEERKKFVEDVFMVFDRAGIESLIDIKIQKLPKVISIIKELNGISKNSRKMINLLVKFLFENFKESAADTIKSKILVNK
jgi:hypothetical protein